MKIAHPKTPRERAIHRCFGDTQGNGENYCTWCDTCKGYHEEHIRVLMAVTNWPCTVAQAYNREVLDRCLEHPVSDRRMFDITYRRAIRLAPYWRRPKETDPHYLQRMVDLAEQKPNWNQILMSDGEAERKKREVLGLPRHLQKKADEIKKKYPIKTRKPSFRRRGKLETEFQSVSVRTARTRRSVCKGSARHGSKPSKREGKADG